VSFEAGRLLASAQELPEVEIFSKIGLFVSYKLESELDLRLVLSKPHLDSLKIAIDRKNRLG
jgi:hypothetical protein